MRKLILLIFAISIVFVSCTKDEPSLAERGEIINTWDKGSYNPTEIQGMLTSRNFDVPFTFTNNINIVKIAYMTPDPAGKLVTATGAILYPETGANLPILSFQHGTQTHRYLIPSQGPANSEASLAGSVAASMGYVVVAADYLGLGESLIVPPYLINTTSAATVIDLMRAAKTYLADQGISTSNSLYLTGYSQGGNVTMATHHEIEKNYSDEFQVSASAPLAGAYDLVLTIDSVLSRDTYIEPVLIANLMYSYDHYYNWDRMNEIFKEPYASAIPGYFDGTLMLDGINAKLTETISDLLQDQFLSDYLAGGETDLLQALEDNSLLNYTPTAPVWFFHGGADMTAPIQNSIAAEAYYESNGKTNVGMTTIPGLNHEDAAAPAIIGAMLWFEELRAK
jgi:dienelactone hydrolase